MKMGGLVGFLCALILSMGDTASAQDLKIFEGHAVKSNGTGAKKLKFKDTDAANTEEFVDICRSMCEDGDADGKNGSCGGFVVNYTNRTKSTPKYCVFKKEGSQPYKKPAKDTYLFDTQQDMDEHAEEMGDTHTDHGDSHGEGEEHSNDTEFDSAQGIPQFALNGHPFYLKTLFRGDDECLEGNVLSPHSKLGGAAFMKMGCGASGQHFRLRLVPRGGDFHLKTSRGGENLCLDGNRFSDKAFLGGAAFMSPCTGGGAYQPGMLWNFVPSERDGYFHLKNRYRGQNECLEGNQVSDQAPLGGAAFMSPCTGQSGMLWKLVPISGG
jgi:hypothetical protein